MSVDIREIQQESFATNYTHSKKKEETEPYSIFGW